MNRRITRRELLRYLGATSGVVVLAACAPSAPAGAPAAAEAPQPAAATEAPAAAASTGPEPLTLPIVSSPLTLSYFVGANAYVKNYNEITLYKEIEKNTGIHIDFQHPPLDPNSATEQFNLMLTSRKFTDVIEWGWLGVPGGPAKALKDGVIIRLNDIIDQYAPNLKQILDDHPDWRKQVVTDEGDIYVFPFLRGDPYLLVFQGPIVRKDWLDKLGLEVPTTIDEWHTMLAAFKEKDPAGDGKTVPFTTMLYGRPLDSFKLSYAFVGAWGITMAYYNDKGTVKFGPLQPEFKDFLGTMAQWYKEGLIDPDSVSMDQKLMDAKVTGNQLGSFIQNTGGGIGKYMGLMQDKDPNFQLVAAPYPSLKPGEAPAFGQRDFVFPGNGAAITTEDKHVKETAKWLDYAYTDAGHMLFNFGPEGLSYTMVDGYPQYTDLIMKNPDKLPVAQAMAMHIRGNSGGPFVQDKRYMEQYAALPVQKESINIWMKPSNDGLMPPVTPTQDESKQFASIMNDVNTRFDEAFIKIMTGADPVDSWDQVVDQLKQMGIEDALKIQQAALDRYNKR